MAQKHDMIDDIIDIQKDWKAVSNPLGSLASAFTAEPQEAKTWNPADYKERPRANTIPCVRCIMKDEGACSRCVDICPVHAIKIEHGSIEIGEECRKCGLCLAVCPTESFHDNKHSPKRLYDQIAKLAAAHETCYVTCTRALSRIPEENEVVLPCVGVLPPELWFALLVEYPNMSVYLPLGICDKCRTTTGEDAYVAQISQAEEWSGRTVGLEVDEGALSHAKKRSYERREFMDSIVRTGQRAFAATNPVLAGAQMVAQRIQEHTKQINQLERSLERVCGTMNSQRRRRTLTQGRQLVLTALQRSPELAGNFEISAPVCDSAKCTMCGECVRVCPQHATDLDHGGRFMVEPAYCVECGACVRACKEGALEMAPADPQALVVPDEEAEKRAEQEARQKAEVERLRTEGRKKLGKTLDMIEGLDDAPQEGEGSEPAKPGPSTKRQEG